jgi:hypothetical protein
MIKVIFHLTPFRRFLVSVTVVAAGPLFGLAACDAAQSSKSDFVEINWTVLPNDAVLNDTDEGRRLRMRIPNEYVRYVSRDPGGEEKQRSGVDNRGIYNIDLEMWLPDLSPTPPIGNTKEQQSTTEQKKVLLQRKLYIQLTANFRRSAGKGLKHRDYELFRAKKGTVYRLPNSFGLEHFRPMYCPPDANFDPARFDEPREAPPEGCRESYGDDSLIGNDSGVNVWITCGRGEGRCAMRTNFQGQWQLTLVFSRSYLPKWREVRRTVEKSLSEFVTN